MTPRLGRGPYFCSCWRRKRSYKELADDSVVSTTSGDEIRVGAGIGKRMRRTLCSAEHYKE